MKTQVILPAAAVCLCLASCATDPAIFEKKKTPSIGRFGVSQPIAAGEEAAPVAPSDPAATAAAPAKPEPQPAPAAPALVAEEAPKKSGGFFSWFKKKEKPAEAPAAVVAEEKPAQKPAEQKPADFADVPAPQRNKGAISEDIRLPNLLGMPEDKELKATNPGTKKTEKEGAVISRPPVEKKD